ncbi:glycosyl hydrolase 115 family protein [Terracidiphilus sp.]|uniref:glycosyl hydrolase 115 family protein n=1 Tax=Terracidiphilus sp. TaxID=1964191 RepID=UPI003C138E75
MMLSRLVRSFCLRCMAFAVPVLLLAAVLPAYAAPSAAVTIDSSVTIVESAQETAPVRRATRDLLADFGKVFGQAPKLVERLEDAGPVAILVAERSRIPAGVHCVSAMDTESFAFSIANAPGSGKQQKRVVCLTGADMRGTIYAIYQFSESWLGVDPMYLWTDKQPEKRSSIALPAEFSKTYPKPVFRYRGFFPNDEDQLTGWIPAAKNEHTGISLKVWDNVYETILRLKGNMVVPGTWVFPDDAQVYAATERGLIVNQHHAIPLGVNVARWPHDVPYNFSTHPEILERAWTNAVATYKPGQEILWSVGLRGLSDSSYASLDPSVRDNDPLLGQRISDAIAEQIKIVRAKYPDAKFVTDLWQEGARLTQKGYIKIPPEVTLVWADTGYGDMQDGGKVAAGQGAYFHVAMMNGNANQLSEMVPVSVIHSELGRYIKAGATSYILVNTSDIRPVAMTTRALMETAWGGVPSGVPQEANDADGAFYRRWATEEFGAKSADVLSALYKEYFAAPSERTSFGAPGLTSAGNAPPAAPPLSPSPLSTVKREEGDQHYHSEIRRLILDELSEHQVIAIPSQSPKWTLPRVMPVIDEQQHKALLAHDIAECEEAQPRWDAVWNHAVAAKDLIEPDRRDYYQAAVLTMISINRESNRALLLVARALTDAEAGQADKAKNEADEALQALDTARHEMDSAEYGKWKNWYRGDWLTGVARTRELVQAYADHLRDPMAPLPAPAAWTGWEAYFHIMEYEGDRSVDVH